MLGHTEAINKAPPHGNGTGDPTATFVTAVGAASSAATTVLGGAAIPSGGVFITWVSDTDCYIRFGDSTVGPATTSDWLLIAGVEKDYRHHPTYDTHFTVLQKTASGTIRRAQSNR